MRLFLSTALLLASVAPGIPTAHAAVVPDATPFLLPGDSAAGAPVGVAFNQLLSNPTLNADGKVALSAILQGEGIDFDNREGIWSNNNGELDLVARINSHAPGLSGNEVFKSFIGNILLNDAGEVAFLGTLSGASPELYSIWSGGDAGIALVAREGQQAPGMPDGVSLSRLTSLRLNSAGQLAFTSGLRGIGINESNDEAIWSRKGGALATIARSGEQTPGLPDGVSFAYFGMSDRSDPSVSFNPLGQTAFLAGVTGIGVDQSNNRGVWSDATGSLSLIVRAGIQAPGAPTGIRFDRFGNPALNSQGHLAFRATLVGNGVDQTNGTGIWIQRNGVLALVARTGDQAPGLTVGVKFGGLAFDSSNDYFEPEINAAGKIAFRAILAGDGISDENDMSIWSESSGVVTMFIREGDQAPGLPDGVVFSSFDPPVLNASGQMVFRGFITGDEINSSNDIGIWAQDLTGELRLIARAGDLLEVSPGEFVQIGHPAFANQSSEQSGASGFNDLGQLAVYAGGIGFISNRVAVPEPRTEIHTAIALVLVGCVMRSRPTRALGVRGGARFGGAPGR